MTYEGMGHMEEQDIKEAKRARNFIWMAACDYDIEPLFLAFAPDGTADIYLNLIIGLTYKWYEQDKIDDFFNQITGKNAALYEGLLWIGLENALYEKERQTRPALYDLRLEYAKKSLAGVNKNREYSRIDTIRNAHCRKILGKPSKLGQEDEELLHAFCFTPDMTTDEIIEKTRENLWKYFAYKPLKVAKPQGIYFLQKVAGAFHSVGKVSTQYVRAKNYYDRNLSSYGTALSMEHSKRYLMQFSLQKDPVETKRYVSACFGESMYSDTQQALIEKKLCVGNHKNCHLLFTRGIESKKNQTVPDEIDNKRERREILEFTKETALQYDKNKEHFQKNRAVYQNSIRRLTESLRMHLETADEAFWDASTHGRIKPASVWKALYLDNPRVFERKDEVETPGFSVDILMDASSSRKQLQQNIAAQAYVLSKSLTNCGIPVQIYSYCSIRGYTVMHIFKEYDDYGVEDELFRYVAAGNNRDGLALRAASHLMEQSQKPKKLLFMFSDASPQDDQIAGEGAFYKDREYTDALAVKDTVNEVQRLKNYGIDVIGIFMGSAHDSELATKIFGRSLVKIKSINEFADAVGRVLNEILT